MTFLGLCVTAPLAVSLVALVFFAALAWMRGRASQPRGRVQSDIGSYRDAVRARAEKIREMAEMLASGEWPK